MCVCVCVVDCEVCVWLTVSVCVVDCEVCVCVCVG